MDSTLNQYIKHYTEHLESDNIQKGYKGLMEYLMHLRIHFIKQHPKHLIIGNFYQGYMDMSYFSITPKALKNLKLKIGLVYNHEKNQFELWLVGQNKQVQKKYWELSNNYDWGKYKISETAQDSIIEHRIVAKPKFDDLKLLTQNIEKETLTFIGVIEKALLA